MPSRPAKSPAEHASEYTNKGVRYWNRDIGDYIRRWSPSIFPNFPELATLAFFAPANPTDNTSTGSSIAFHEIGLGQVPAGPRGEPAPNPNRNARWNAWGRYGVDPSVRLALGRDGVLDASWSRRIDDQTAIGLRMLRGDFEGIQSRLPESIRASSAGTKWGIALTFLGFGDGASGYSKVTRYTSALAAVPEHRRLETWIYSAAQEAAAGTLSYEIAHRILRIWQKIKLAQSLANTIGMDSSPFDLDFGSPQNEEAYAQALLRVDHGQSARDLSIPQLSESKPGYILPVAAISAGLYILYKYTNIFSKIW